MRRRTPAPARPGPRAAAGAAAARRARPGDERERRHDHHLGEDLPPHGRAGRARGPAQAELADPLRHALPDDAGQAERDHQQQEAGDVPTTVSGIDVLAQLVAPQVLEGGHANDQSAARAAAAGRASPNAAVVPGRTRISSRSGSAGVRDVEPHAVEQEGLRRRERAVLPEVLDHADDALDSACRCGSGGGASVFFRDDLADRVGVAENLPRQLDVDHHRRPRRRIVLAREPAAGDDGDRQQRREVVGHAVVDVVDLAAAGQRQPAAPVRVGVRPGERAGRDLDLRQLAERHQQPGEHLAMARLRRAAASAPSWPASVRGRPTSIVQTRSISKPSGCARVVRRSAAANRTTPKTTRNEKKISTVSRKFWRLRFQIRRNR